MSRLSGGVLSGLKVLDLSQAMAGPFCTQILADHGADVVKIEPPGGGDLARGGGPFHPADVDNVHSSYFHSVNRNKRSAVIDLKSEEGRDLILQMIPHFDVIVENFRVGVMERLGLSYELIQEHNPRIVYATVRGFGDPRNGASPYADWPAFDVVAQAMGGIVGITGPDADTPIKVGPGVGDSIAALYLAIGVLGAVLHARATGEGQFVDVAMVDSILAVSERIVNQWSFKKEVARPEGNHQPLVAPFGIFPTRDGHAAIAAPTDKFFAKLCRLLDLEELLDDPDFGSLLARGQKRKRLIELISQRTVQMTKAELSHILGGQVPFAPVYMNREIFEDEHFTIREMLAEISCDGLPEPVWITGTPIKYLKTPGGVRKPGPGMGEHTEEVLLESGFAPSQIEEWKKAGIVK